MEIKDIQKEAIRIRNLYSEFEKKKCGREWNNQEIAMGFSADVGELMKLIMTKEGLRDTKGMNDSNIDDELAHELSDCLWCVLVLAGKYNIDIEKAFLDTMKKIEERTRV